ncbi:MAG: helix-turn-helix domain-containing protein [Candidatus Melainabacteria bacterium]|nr:helix-turn-helix domain-containing protein [Candidatus Melainabacteria bacterium]
MNRAPEIDKDYWELVRRFPLVPIKNEHMYKRASALLDELVDRLDELTAGEQDYLSVLGSLIAESEKDLPIWQDTNATPRELLAYLIQESGLTLTELAKLVGTYESNLSAFLAGRRGFGKSVSLKLAEYFRVHPDAFMSSTKRAY